MVNAGRILILTKGDWSSLVTYEQLDLVSDGDVAYLARQASVGVRPSTDTSKTYWQPSGMTRPGSVVVAMLDTEPNGCQYVLDVSVDGLTPTDACLAR